MSKEIQKRTTAAIVQKGLEDNRSAIMASLPRGFNYDRMVRATINAIATTPGLAKCTPLSLFRASVNAFCCGIEPNTPLHLGYLVPYKTEATFLPSYRGLIAIARRSGDVGPVYAREVCEHDTFALQLGTANTIEHVPKLDGDRGGPIGYYAVFRLHDGSVDFEYMTLSEIEAIRKRSPAANRGPWVDDNGEMCKKTVIKRLMKRAPASIELAGAIALDNAVETGEEQGLIIDIVDLEPPTEGTSSLEQPNG